MTEEIARTLAQTWTHLCDKTFAGLPTAAAVAVLQRPAVVALIARVDRLALTGDVLATQRACQAWVRTCRKEMAA